MYGSTRPLGQEHLAAKQLLKFPGSLGYTAGNLVDTALGATASPSSLDETVEPLSSTVLTLGAARGWDSGAVGRTNVPVLLKRGMSASIEELLCAAEYVLAAGNHQVVLCERGIRTFETATRNTLDLSAVPVLKARTHLPVVVDPSHAAGVRWLVAPLARAAAAIGADGLLVEAHPDPDTSVSDREQALSEDQLKELMASIRPILESIGRTL